MRCASSSRYSGVKRCTFENCDTTRANGGERRFPVGQHRPDHDGDELAQHPQRPRLHRRRQEQREHQVRQPVRLEVALWNSQSLARK